MTIRILIAEDQAMVRGALSALLFLENDMEVVSEVSRADDIVGVALASQPDVALLDIEMPGGDGITAAALLHQKLPNCRILILTTFGRPGYLRRAMESGVVGFLVKDAPAAELAQSIRKAMKGARVIDPELAKAALSQGENPLTERERTILRVASDGASIEDIASKLYISHGTVRNHLSSAIQKLGVKNRAEAVHAAKQQGWI